MFEAMVYSVGGLSLAGFAYPPWLLEFSLLPLAASRIRPCGCTKGGLNTKLSTGVDGGGQAVSLSLVQGQHADVNVAQSAAWPKWRGTITVADQGNDSEGFRAQLGRW